MRQLIGPFTGKSEIFPGVLALVTDPRRQMSRSSKARSSSRPWRRRAGCSALSPTSSRCSERRPAVSGDSRRNCEEACGCLVRLGHQRVWEVGWSFFTMILGSAARQGREADGQSPLRGEPRRRSKQRPVPVTGRFRGSFEGLPVPGPPRKRTAAFRSRRSPLPPKVKDRCSNL
jgi:hypothetical protein